MNGNRRNGKVGEKEALIKDPEMLAEVWDQSEHHPKGKSAQ